MERKNIFLLLLLIFGFFLCFNVKANEKKFAFGTGDYENNLLSNRDDDNFLYKKGISNFIYLFNLPIEFSNSMLLERTLIQLDGVDSSLERPNIEGISICDENGIQKAFQVIGYLLFVVKILVPLLLIILGTIDFSKAIITSDEKATKEASSSLIKRVIIGIAIFIIPTILNFAFSLVDGAKETSSGFTKCTNCLFNPNDGTKCSPKKIGE